MSITGKEHQPLDYYVPSTGPRPPDGSVADSCFAAAVAFAVGHWIAEYFTARVLLFHFHVLWTPTSAKTLADLEGRFVRDMVIETFWIAFAAVLVFVVQWLLNYQLPATRRRRRVWLMGLALGVAYCWVRWGIWRGSRAFAVTPPELIDFGLAMGLAVVAGLLLAQWRRPPRRRQ